MVDFRENGHISCYNIVVRQFTKTTSQSNVIPTIAVRKHDLPAKFGGLAIPINCENVQCEYESSKKAKTSLAMSIKEQSRIYSVDETDQKTIKENIESSTEERYKETLTELRTHMNDCQKCFKTI